MDFLTRLQTLVVREPRDGNDRDTFLSKKNVDNQEDQNGDEERSIHQIPDKEDQDEKNNNKEEMKKSLLYLQNGMTSVMMMKKKIMSKQLKRPKHM